MRRARHPLAGLLAEVVQSSRVDRSMPGELIEVLSGFRQRAAASALQSAPLSSGSAHEDLSRSGQFAGP